MAKNDAVFERGLGDMTGEGRSIGVLVKDSKRGVIGELILAMRDNRPLYESAGRPCLLISDT